MKRLVSLLLAIIMVMSIFTIIPFTANAADTTTVYFQNNWMWTDVHVYYWFNGGAQNNGEWPGQPAEKFGNDGTYDVYSVTLPAGVEGVIFNGFDGGINALNQTPDISGFSEGNCYSMVWNGANGVEVQDINDVIKVEPTDPIPTTPIPTDPIPTEDDTDGLFVRVDGTEYPVTKGATYTYQYTISVPDVKISGIDVLTTFDTDGLDLIPYMNGTEIDNAKHFPALSGVVSNVTDYDGEVYYNYSNYKGISLNDAVLFQGQFKVTADKGIFDIDSKIKTMIDTDITRYVYNFEILKSFTQTEKFTDGDNPIEPTEDKPEPGKIFVNLDGTKYEVAQGDVITYQYTLNVPDVKISSFDANTFYDTDGLDLVPFMVDGEVDDVKHFPALPGVIANVTDIDGEVYYNYANHKGTKLENAVIFTAQFKVTASSGTYDITTRILTMADTSMNALVYDYEKLGNYTEKFELVDYVEPSSTVKPTTVKPTQPDTPTGKVYVNADGKKYEVSKGDVITYEFKLTVPNVKISSFDANTFFDTDGLEIIPFMDGSEIDNAKHFPALPNAISNFEHEGEVYYNYANYKGVKLDDAVIFTAQFKVTASSGTYDITTRIFTMADTDMNAIVYDYEKKGDFTQESALVDYVEPTTPDEPEKPTTVVGNDLYLNVDGTKYAVEQGKTYTYEYRLTVPVKVASFDANTFYDTEGIDVVPFMDGEYVDDAQHFPKFATVISNFDIDGEIYYNYSNHKGITIDNAVIFTAQFKVTASSGTYDITTRIKTMADTSQNRIVYNYEKLSEFSEESELVGYVKPSEQPTKPGEHNLFLNVDGTKYAVEQGQTYTYQYTLNVPGVKISSFDANTFYDTDGIDLVPFMVDGEVDDTQHFPAFASVIANVTDIDGEIYYNYANHKGVKLENAVIFTAQFKVTASSGTYDITTRILTMADTAMNALVYDYEKLGDFTEKSELVGYVEPSTDKPGDLLIGDVNFDGYVNIFDATDIQFDIAGMLEFDDTQKYVGDVNDDGEINIFDVTDIQLFVAGHITEFKKK